MVATSKKAFRFVQGAMRIILQLPAKQQLFFIRRFNFHLTITLKETVPMPGFVLH